ncbi:translocation/assembly module TamB domain-containing protein [Thermodesulfobium acidiphilum]|uniref:translocation/assembly module TamB domain-containing protein n=1 Tax=Thermodesulfobium acidiphilum TaxID=1794699 RepID=UPI0019026383|nr:translocation/assembly module TamB domain-containing protein [Thermodesulfobium acidiphilum]
MNTDNIKRTFIYPTISSNLPEGTNFQSADIGLNKIIIHNVNINDDFKAKKVYISFSISLMPFKIVPTEVKIYDASLNVIFTKDKGFSLPEDVLKALTPKEGTPPANFILDFYNSTLVIKNSSIILPINAIGFVENNSLNLKTVSNSNYGDINCTVKIDPDKKEFIFDAHNVEAKELLQFINLDKRVTIKSGKISAKGSFILEKDIPLTNIYISSENLTTEANNHVFAGPINLYINYPNLNLNYFSKESDFGPIKISLIYNLESDGTAQIFLPEYPLKELDCTVSAYLYTNSINSPYFYGRFNANNMSFNNIELKDVSGEINTDGYSSHGTLEATLYDYPISGGYAISGDKFAFVGNYRNINFTLHKINNLAQVQGDFLFNYRQIPFNSIINLSKNPIDFSGTIGSGNLSGSIVKNTLLSKVELNLKDFLDIESGHAKLNINYSSNTGLNSKVNFAMLTRYGAYLKGIGSVSARNLSNMEFDFSLFSGTNEANIKGNQNKFIASGKDISIDALYQLSPFTFEEGRLIKKPNLNFLYNIGTIRGFPRPPSNKILYQVYSIDLNNGTTILSPESYLSFYQSIIKSIKPYQPPVYLKGTTSFEISYDNGNWKGETSIKNFYSNFYSFSKAKVRFHGNNNEFFIDYADIYKDSGELSFSGFITPVLNISGRTKNYPIEFEGFNLLADSTFNFYHSESSTKGAINLNSNNISYNGKSGGKLSMDVSLNYPFLKVNNLSLEHDGHTATLKGTLPMNKKALKSNETTDLKLSISNSSIALLSFLLPKNMSIKSSEGSIDLKVSGSFDSPTLSGNANIPNMTILVNNQEIKLKDFNAKLTGDEINLAGYLIENGGIASLEGHINGTSKNLDITILGKNFNANFGKTYNGLADFYLNLGGSIFDPVLKGNINLIKGHMGFPNNSASVLPNIKLNLNINIGRDVDLRNDFYTLYPSGSVKVEGTLNNPIIFADLNINSGRISVFDQPFQITRGNIKYTPLAHTVNILAQSSISEYKVYLTVSGQLENPKLSFSSVPELSESQIIALIGTGKNPVTYASTVAAMSPITAVSQAQGILFEPIKQALGLSRLSFGMSVDGKPEITVSKSWNKKISTSVTYTLGTKPQATYQADLQLSKATSLVIRNSITDNISFNRGTFVGLYYRFRF